jgi:two-component system chemotaxis response regulator CheB
MAKKLFMAAASLGGIDLWKKMIGEINLSQDSALVIAIHIIEGDFAGKLVELFQKFSRYNVELLKDGDQIRSGTIYVCDGGMISSFKNSVGNSVIATVAPMSSLIKVGERRISTPNFDILFSSAVHLKNIVPVGIIMTGAANDGVRGLMEMKKNGLITIAQDENSSYVFGQNKAAIEAGAATTVLSAGEIISYINAG